MSDIVERLRENIIADAFEQRHVVSGELAERLIRERQDAADEIEKLRAALKPFADMLTSEQMQALIGVKDSDWTRAVVTMGDLRAAATALKETGDE